MTYLLLTASVLAAAFVYLLLMRSYIASKPLVAASAVMLLITAIFDNVIIATGIVAYDEAKISGIKIGVAPIEDFAYTLVALLVAPTLFNFFRVRL